MRPFKDGDAESMLEYHSNSEVVRYIPWEVRTLEEIKESNEKNKSAFQLNEEGDYLTLALCRKSDDQLVGQMNAMYRSKEHMRAEFGYVVNPRFGGQGYITEAATALISALFASELFHSVFANMDPRNHASEKVAIRVGLNKEAHHKEDYWFKGEWTDSFIYATVKDEWQSRH